MARSLPGQPSSDVSRDRAARILQRAAELDASSHDRVALEDLRDAATDAGISRAAFLRAVAEAQSGPTPTLASAPEALARQFTPGTIIKTAVLAGRPALWDSGWWL